LGNRRNTSLIFVSFWTTLEGTVDLVVPIAMDKNSGFSVRIGGDGMGSASVAVKRPVLPVVRRAFSPRDLATSIARVFANLGPNNPLRAMNAADRKAVWGSLMIFAESIDDPHKSLHLERMEHLAKVVSDAARLSAEIEKLLRNDYGEVLNRRLIASKGLPAQLNSFMIEVGGLLYATGFQKQRAFADCPLIYASELVRLRTGTWNDVHLEELLRAMRDEDKEYSGDAIHKKRERFKASYPLIYRLIVQKVSRGEPLFGRGTVRRVRMGTRERPESHA
jgi:hypothetical protein